MLKIVEFGLLAGVLVVVVALIATSRKDAGSSEAQMPPSADSPGQEQKTAH